MERHQLIALIIACAVFFFVWFRDGLDTALREGVVLLIVLLLIMFYRVIRYFAGFGFPEFFAADYGSANHPGPYAFFFWLVFVIVCLFMVFDWSIY